MNARGVVTRYAAGFNRLKRALSGRPADNQRITRDHVVWAYRILLDREPESEAVISDKLKAYGTTQQLRADIMTSPEFRLKNPGNFPHVGEAGIVITELDHDLRLYVELSDLVIGQNIIRGCYERSEIAFVREMVEVGQTVIDVGANIGFFTVYMAVFVGPSGRVYAFEPLRRNAELLKRSVAENGLGDRVVVEQAAVGQSSGPGKLLFLEHMLNSGGSYLFEDGMQIPDGHGIQHVQVVALDEYALLGPVSFIKMDIEGAEPLALRGARRILSTDRPIVLSELNPVALKRGSACTPAEWISEMRALEYDCYVLEDGRPSHRVLNLADSSVRSVVFLPRPG